MAAGSSVGSMTNIDEGGDGASGLPCTRDIALLLGRFACNNHTIADEELRPVGVGIYPLGALVNHACDPNCMQSFKGTRIEFRCVLVPTLCRIA